MRGEVGAVTRQLQTHKAQWPRESASLFPFLPCNPTSMQEVGDHSSVKEN